MSVTAIENPALRRMLRPSRPVTSGARMSEARAWRSSLPRVSESRISLVASVAGYEVTDTDLEAIFDGWDGFALSILTCGPDETCGLVQLDAGLRAGLVEAQTMGRVQNTPLADRPGTPLDAALCDHVVNAWMDGAAVAGETVNPWKTVRMLKDTRAAKVILDDGDYTATDVTISLGEGARTGLLRILRPEAAKHSARAGKAETGGTGHSGFLALEAEIEAVLYRAKVPYHWLRDLKPGAILEMPRGVLDNVQIETVEGKRITRARLGRKGPKRAVRIVDENAPGTSARPARGQDAFAEGPMGMAPAAPGDMPAPAPMAGLPDLPDPEPPGGLPDIPGLPPLGGD